MRFSFKAMLRNCRNEQDSCWKQTYEYTTNLQCDEIEQDVNYNDVFAFQFDPNL